MSTCACFSLPLAGSKTLAVLVCRQRGAHALQVKPCIRGQSCYRSRVRGTFAARSVYRENLRTTYELSAFFESTSFLIISLCLMLMCDVYSFFISVFEIQWFNRGRKNRCHGFCWVISSFNIFIRWVFFIFLAKNVITETSYCATELTDIFGKPNVR